MRDALLYALAGLAGGVGWHVSTKYLLRWSGRKEEYASGVVRGLSHDGFLTYYHVVRAEARRRGIEPTAEEVGQPSKEKEPSS